MGPRKGRKRDATTPPPDSRTQPAQPGSRTGNTQPPTPAGPREHRSDSNSESTSSLGETDDLSIITSPSSASSDNISLFPNITGAMADSVTRFTVEHGEKERIVEHEVNDIKAKTKNIEKLIKEKHPEWLVVQRCSQLKDKVDSFLTLSKDLISKSNQMNISLQLCIHDPKTDDTKIARCKQLSEVLLKSVKQQSEIETVIDDLTCPFIARIPDTSTNQPNATPATSTQTSSNIFGSFDYLRPTPLSSDCTPDSLEIFRQSFTTWFGLICGGQENINNDKAFMFASLSQSLDNEWQTFIRQKPDIGTKTMEDIFQILEDQMLISKPMSIRRSEFIKIRQEEGENAPSFLRRVMAKARAADIEKMTPQELILLMFAMNLSKTDISHTIRTSVFDYLQKNKSIDDLNSVISSVEQIQSNFTSTQRVTASNERTRRTKEGHPPRSDEWGRECRLCDGKHYYKKECSYSCRNCHIRGSHKTSECRGGRRKERNWDNNPGQNERYRNKDKRFRRSKSQDKAYKRTSERERTPGKALRIQADNKDRDSSPNSSPNDNHRRSNSIPPNHGRRDPDTRVRMSRVRTERSNSAGRRHLFGEHSSLFDSVRITPQQQQYPRSTIGAGEQPTKRACNRVKEMKANKDKEHDDDIVELIQPAVPMPRSSPKTYKDWKMQKIQNKLWNIANQERMNGSHSEESTPADNGSHSHSNHA